jgi:hypothetical protein
MKLTTNNRGLKDKETEKTINSIGIKYTDYEVIVIFNQARTPHSANVILGQMVSKLDKAMLYALKAK